MSVAGFAAAFAGDFFFVSFDGMFTSNLNSTFSGGSTSLSPSSTFPDGAVNSEKPAAKTGSLGVSWHDRHSYR